MKRITFLAIFILGALFAGIAQAGDTFPGKLLYSKGKTSFWKAEINIAAPVGQAIDYHISQCINVGPFPCDFHIKAGGALTITSDFLRDTLAFNEPEIGVLDAPMDCVSASSFLSFNDGHFRTAFTAPTLRWRLDNPLDDYRAYVAGNNAGKQTCVTFYNEAEESATITVRSFDETGELVIDPATHWYAPFDVYYIPSKNVMQSCVTPKFDAGSLRLQGGCIGYGPCGGTGKTWFVVTKGPGSGATIETLPVQNLGAVEVNSTASAIAPAAHDVGAPIRVHGVAPLKALEAIERHNAEVAAKHPLIE